MSKRKSARNLLLFLNDKNIVSQYLESDFSKKFDNILIVTKSNCFQIIEKNIFQVGNSIDDYSTLLRVIEQKQINVTDILHLWSLEKYGSTDSSEMERGIYSIYFLIKKLMEEKLIHPEMNILYVYPSEKDDSYPFYAE
ncbi:hypothetical protein HFP68_28315 [Bacillus sp. CB28A.1]